MNNDDISVDLSEPGISEQRVVVVQQQKAPRKSKSQNFYSNKVAVRVAPLIYNVRKSSISYCFLSDL